MNRLKDAPVRASGRERAASILRVGAVLLSALVLAACPKKGPEPSDEIDVESSPAPEPTDILNVFGSGGTFSEPDPERDAALALAGRLSCPPLRIKDSLACVIGEKIILLRQDGISRSADLPGRVEILLCSLASKDGDYLALALSDGRLLCLDYGSLAVFAERPAGGGAAFALSGTKILRASGKTIERIALPSLAVEESAECPAAIARLAANGRDCLVFSGGEGISSALILPADNLKSGIAGSADGSSANETESGAPGDGGPAAAWAAPFGAGFLVLLADGRAAYLESGRDTRYLEGSFDADRALFASGSRAALARRDGGLRLLSQDGEGEIEAVDTQAQAETAVALEGGWLWYGAGRLGFARSSGAELWDAPLSPIPVFPPFAWEGRIAVCARDGLYLLPGIEDPALEAMLETILIPTEAEESIAAVLGQQRPMEGRASIEPYRPGARKPFGKGWRIAVFEPESGVERRLRIKGKEGYFILVFDQDGNKLASNFAYELEESLSLTMSAGKKYAIAFAPRDPAADAEPVELSITE